MLLDRRSLLVGAPAALVGLAGVHPSAALDLGSRAVVDVRHFGAKGNGTHIDSPAIDRAIRHVAKRGGGTVWFPAGTYACYTIHLESRVTLHLGNGATILAAPPPTDGRGGYDLAEPNPFDMFQDFGHSHWHNSLILGDGLHDIAIEGQGLIWGRGLGRGDGKDDWLKDPSGPGTGNKAIALKNCRNVTIRDVRMLEGGWFAILATGVDNLTIDNVLCDTNRDGFDIDCCRNVRVSNCTVNAPYDDAICPKSSYALGEARVTENVAISNCLVAGNYQVGSVLDGSWRPMPPEFAPLIHGRIKFGTETNGGFRNIAVTNCIFQDSRGLAFQTVDGGVVEDVVVSNITMRGVINAPIFLRLGRRMRGPAGRAVGSMKRISIRNVTSSGANQLPSVIAGLADHPIEDLTLSDMFLHHVGGAPTAMAALLPPENELAYPEAPMFGDLPATGIFARHVRGLTISNVEVALAQSDPRAAFVLADVADVDVARVRVPAGAPAFQLRDVRAFRHTGSRAVPDRAITDVATMTF